MSKQPPPINLLNLAEEFAMAISLLPGFESCTEGQWEEADQEVFPTVTTAQFGYVEDVQISVAQTRMGGTQISFVLDHPIDEDDFLVGVTWRYHSISQVDLDTDTVQLPVRLRIEGNYEALLAHDAMLRAIRLTDDLLSGLLLNDAKTILSSPMLDPQKGDMNQNINWGLSPAEQRHFFFSFYTRLATVV